MYSHAQPLCSLQKLNCTFVDPVPSSTPAAALGVTNKVVYSAVRPHDQKSEDKQDDTTSTTSAHVSVWIEFVVFHWGFFNVAVAPGCLESVEWNGGME